MNIEEIRKVIGISIYVAKKNNFGWLAKDFSQYCLLRILESHSDYYRISYFWIDYLRENFGDHRYMSSKNQFRLQERSLDPNIHVLLQKPYQESLILWGADQLQGRDREIFLAYYQDGLTLKAIGKIHSISESRVAQRMKRIVQELKEAEKFEW